MNGSASAPGKAILLGEHAVVYGAPAIAIPLTQLRAYADWRANDSSLTIHAADLDQPPARLRDLDPTDPLAAMARLALRHLGVVEPGGEITIRSDIPIASGLGSGAAVSAALGRAAAGICGRTIGNDALNELVFEVEKLHHGTPGGIDNTTVVYEKPIAFARGQPFRAILPPRALHFALADSGVAALTRESVASVRELLATNPRRTRHHLNRIAKAVQEARDCIRGGDVKRLGELMNANHAHLRSLGVSSTRLDRLVAAATGAGAAGAKLSGGGRGGHIIALVEPNTACAVRSALWQAGAARVFTASIGED